MADKQMKTMIETTLSLTVPVDRGLREEIRQKTDQYFSVNPVAPPVPYNKLAEYSDTLLEIYGWEKSYKAFVMVCCGNAIWRSVVGSIAYNRRMLLLPQCLKNSNMCKATQDEMGLLCSECGNCNISGFLQEAEQLGYITIVAEGTTIASKLVESGKVDAVIGVGCMEVLQKIFLAVNKYSVPAIGVPLLSCGCIDTKADETWIREEINNINLKKRLNIINLNNLRETTESLFTPAQTASILKLGQSATDNIVREILLAGGKRVRPLLTALAYGALSKSPDSDVLAHLAMSVECFHKASLIHDDIEDDDQYRYGKETVHKRYGIPVAINIGDLLIGDGYRLISECKLQPADIARCLHVISNGHKELSTGQGIELIARANCEFLTADEIINIFINKTSAAFRVSLLVGAVAAGADNETIRTLESFSHHIGIAYQIKDDLEDFDPHAEKRSFRNPSIVIATLLSKADPRFHEEIKQAVLANDIASIDRFLQEYEVKDDLTASVGKYLDKIENCLSDLENVSLKLALHELVGKTFRDFI